MVVLDVRFWKDADCLDRPGLVLIASDRVVVVLAAASSSSLLSPCTRSYKCKGDRALEDRVRGIPLLRSDRGEATAAAAAFCCFQD